MTGPVRWQQAVAALHQAGEGFVLVTVLETRGSTPRDADSKMVVTSGEVFDTIGGGRLEYRTIDIARELIASSDGGKIVEEFSLGPKLDQCCGGHVKILFEHFRARGFDVELHGAGHVGRAIATILAGLDCRVRWIDERPEAFPDRAGGNLARITARSSAGEVARAPAGAWHLVMTHSHPLDLEIVDAVLSRGDFSYLGLIGSRSKAARFRKRLAERGFSEDEMSSLACPIGLPELGGKEPMEIAVSVVADLLKRRQQDREASDGGAALELVRR